VQEKDSRYKLLFLIIIEAPDVPCNLQLRELKNARKPKMIICQLDAGYPESSEDNTVRQVMERECEYHM